RAQANALEPQDAVDYFLLGDYAYRRRDWPVAIDHLESTLRLEPEHFGAHFLIAMAHLRSEPRSGRPSEAATHFTVCPRLQPQFVWSYILRGVAYGEFGRILTGNGRSDEARLRFAQADADFRQAQERLDGEPNEDAQYALLVNRGYT